MTKQTQVDKFKQAARELETDDDEKLGKVARQKLFDPKKSGGGDR